MKMRLLLTAVVLAAGVASAGTFSVDLTTVFSGATPPGSSPWGTATFTDVSNTNCGGSLLGCVQLTMTGNLQDASNFITEWDFNVSQTGLTGLGITAGTITGATAPTIDPYSSNAYKADGDGFYDFGFQYATAAAGRFTGTDSAIFYVTGIGASVTTASFETASQLSDSKGTYVTAAHVQGITSGNQTCSGWVGGITTNAGTAVSGPSGDCLPSVPEPMHSGLFLTSSLIGFVVLARKRLFGQA